MVEALQSPADSLVRKGEGLFKSLDQPPTSEVEWLRLMVKYPALIERPIVVNGNKVAIGRPPENILNNL